MGKGTLWTETDVLADSWYLDDEGRMPAGIMIESGQADLLLISWLGIDSLNQGERVYRLLGCDLTYSAGLPVPGDTLCYDIHVDGHATQGDVRLFFFHYDCKVRGETRLTVRNGQAGFFTDEELANSAGVLWDPVGRSTGCGAGRCPGRQMHENQDFLPMNYWPFLPVDRTNVSAPVGKPRSRTSRSPRHYVGENAVFARSHRVRPARRPLGSWLPACGNAGHAG